MPQNPMSPRILLGALENVEIGRFYFRRCVQVINETGLRTLKTTTRARLPHDHRDRSTLLQAELDVVVELLLMLHLQLLQLLVEVRDQLLVGSVDKLLLGQLRLVLFSPNS